jgi:hypothetical protein
VLLAPGAAWAADWSGTFPADAVDTHLEGSDLKLVVVAGGDTTEDLTAATAALADALRNAGKVQVVMDGSAIGDTAGLDDKTIVGKAENLPADQVVIVRVFPGKGDQFSAVVTAYAKDGSAKGGFSASTDKPLSSKAGGGGGGGAVGMDPGAAVSAVTRGNTDELQAQFDEYLERRVWFQGMAAVSAQNGAVMSTWSVPYKGKYKEPLPGVKFYEYVGEPEIAKTVRTRQWVRRGIGVGSTALMVGGLWGLSKNIDGLSSPGCWAEDDPEEQEDCEDDYEEEEEAYARKMRNLAILSGVGFVGVYVPLFIKTDPTPVSERYRMADEYNKALREELGLPDDLSGFKSGTDYGVRMGIGASAGANGATANFTLQF